MTDAERLASVQARIDSINQQKMAAQAELNVLKSQYDEKVKELATYGIIDVSNLPATIEILRKEFETKVAEAEAALTKIEAALCPQQQN